MAIDPVTIGTVSPHVVQSVGQVNIRYKHPSINSGADIYLSGFKLDSEYLTTTPAVQNSVLIPLVGGGSVQLTNANLSGSITFTVSRLGNTVQKNPTAWGTGSDDHILTGIDDDGAEITYANTSDLVSLAQAQLSLVNGDYSGAMIIVEYNFNSSKFQINFHKCTVQTCDPLHLSGNDVPTYSVVFNYAKWSIPNS
jgi:uncharacterized protein YjbI with pentapeptide repeats